MTHVLASYAEKPRQELVRLDSFEILTSPLSAPIDYPRAAALAFYTEVLEESLVERDPQDAIFRLMLSVLAETRPGCLTLPVTYFALWMPRLLGWLPSLARCVRCRQSLREQQAAYSHSEAYYHAEVDGLLCVEHRLPGARRLRAESLALAERILSKPLQALVGDRAICAAAEQGTSTVASDLRHFATLTLERHLEYRLLSARALSRIRG